MQIISQYNDDIYDTFNVAEHLNNLTLKTTDIVNPIYMSLAFCILRHVDLSMTIVITRSNMRGTLC